MNKELRKSFSELKTKCDTPEKRRAYNKLVKTFNNKSITKDWMVDLIDTWRNKQRNEFAYDSDDFVKLAKKAEMKSIEIDFIGGLTITGQPYTADWMINDNDPEIGKSEFTSMTDVNLYNVLKFLLSLT